jgi:hypothetical protein
VRGKKSVFYNSIYYKILYFVVLYTIKFSKGIHVVILCSEYPRALTFEASFVSPQEHFVRAGGSCFRPAPETVFDLKQKLAGRWQLPRPDTKGDAKSRMLRLQVNNQKNTFFICVCVCILMRVGTVNVLLMCC